MHSVFSDVYSDFFYLRGGKRGATAPELLPQCSLGKLDTFSQIRRRVLFSNKPALCFGLNNTIVVFLYRLVHFLFFEMPKQFRRRFAETAFLLSGVWCFRVLPGPRGLHAL